MNTSSSVRLLPAVRRRRTGRFTAHRTGEETFDVLCGHEQRLKWSTLEQTLSANRCRLSPPHGDGSGVSSVAVMSSALSVGSAVLAAVWGHAAAVISGINVRRSGFV